jgi:hypothetical protein
MEHLLEYLFYGVYATAFAFLLLVLYLNRTNRRLNYLLSKINKLSGTDENEGFPKSKIRNSKLRVLRLLVKVRQTLNNIKIRRYIHEYFLAANFITVIGSILFVLGVGFFVRFPGFDYFPDIISRAVIALGGSLLLIFISHTMYRKHPAFSSVIMGGAFSILYFTLITAYYNYHLFSTGTAFIIAILITAFSVLLSLGYKRYSLVTLAFIAGYSTPFLVDYTNSDTFLLFNYLILLDIGVLVLVIFKKSLFLNLTAFAFTGVYFLIWLVTSIQIGHQANYDIGFVYLLIFFIILLPLNTISNMVKRIFFLPFELSVVITLNMMVYAAGMYMLLYLNPDYRGLFTALLAVFNLIFLYILLTQVKYNQRLVYLTIGLIIIFVTLIPPVELVGRSISMVWALQLILLLWISQKLDVVLMKLGAVLISLALIYNTLAELLGVLHGINPLAEPKDILINTDFMSGFAAALSLLFSIFLMNREKGKYIFKPLRVKLYQIFAGIAAGILLYFSLFVEIKYQVTTHVASFYARQIIMGIYNFTFAGVIVAATVFLEGRKIKFISLIPAALIFTGYLLFYYLVVIRARSQYIAEGGISLAQFSAVFIIDLITVGVMYAVHLNLKQAYKNNKFLSQFTLWPLVIFVFIASSLALDHYWVIQYADQGIMASELLEEAHRMPYTVLWAILALLLTFFGTIFKQIQLRQISLFAVLVVLVKLLLSDMAVMNTEERTVAMLVVGAVLLFIALIYQFNKKKFDDLEPEHEKSENFPDLRDEDQQ